MAGDGRGGEHAVGLVHDLQGGLGVAHRLVDPGHGIQPQGQQKRLDHLPAERDRLGGMLLGGVQLVAGIQDLGDPDVRLTLVARGQAAALGGEA
jgi:hypothetical protein